MHWHPTARRRERPNATPRSVAPLLVLVAVLALHVGLYVALRGSVAWNDPRAARPAAPRVSLRLLPWREPALPPRPKSISSGALPLRAAPLRRARDAISAPTASPATATQSAAVTGPAPPAEWSASQPRPLDLTLPRGFTTRPGAGHPAIDDARSNTARTTPEQRMAKSFDTALIEESFGDGRRRFRRGDDCVIVSPSRIGQLMPFNEAAARSPSLVSACR